MTTEFKVGDVVCFKAEFLRSIQWNTDVPENGIVRQVFPHRCYVQWCTDDKDNSGTPVALKNLILYNERHLEPI